MFLREVRILNFRSIQNQTLSFTDTNRCRILVGINESGKSNVLRALSMISRDVEPLKEDVREPSPKEGAVKKSFIRFIFHLDNEEVSTVNRKIAVRFLTKAKSPELFATNEGDQTLDQFCASHGTGVYRVNVIKGTKEAVHFVLVAAYLLRSRWKKISASAASSEKLLTLRDGREVDLDEFLLVDTESYPEIPPEILEEADANYVYAAIGVEINKVIKENLPSCVYWAYSDKNLLPSRINLLSFVQDPDTCLPLKNMFLLAGVDNIADAIREAQEKSTHGFRNLLSLVATMATKHIHAIWKEYKGIEIRLEPYGPTEIDAGVKDAHNIFEMSRRSDGFKRFVSFLLLVSAKVRTNQLVNTLLLIDEPDNGLHPSGARYLKDELITIAGANYVVFSTHSIFMIDKGKIDRHLIVKKEKEVTGLLEANESNFVDEEVLYNALGYSIFEILAEQNLLFEGWRDKRLFEVALARVPAKYKEIKDILKNIGRCHAQGVKDIRYIAPLLELANRGCFIISDDH
ncbi:MAG: AAA family ATPase [Nitrospiraceae bacterium]